jgi:hypothetical protein
MFTRSVRTPPGVWQARRAVLLAAGMLAASIARGGAPAAIAAPGTGPVLTGLTAPGNPVWIGTHMWIPDGTLGFCRVDTATAGSLTITASCDTQAKNPASAVLDPRPIPGWPNTVDRYVYIADASFKALGVMRVVWQASTETIVPGSGEVLAGGSNQTGLRPDAVALGPDGNVYVGFKKNSNLVRITGANTTGTQTVVVISQTSDGRKGVAPGGLAFIPYTDPATGVTHGDLYVAELGGNGVTAVVAADTCSVGGVQCGAAEATPLQSFFPQALNTDGTGKLLISESPVTATIGLPSSVLRYDPATDTQDVVTSAHTLPDGTLTPYRWISGVALLPDGAVYVAEDPSLGLTQSAGKLWQMPSGAPVDALGQPGIPALAPPPAPGAAERAGLPPQVYSWGQQAPNGFIFLPGALGGHLWVADESGLCRLDPTPDGLHALNVEVCDPGNVGTPATPSLDPRPNPDGTQYLYIPEIDRFSAGVWRAKYDPSTETILPNSVELMAPFADLGKMRPNSALLGPDGTLYVTGKSAGAAALGETAATPGAVIRIKTPHGPTRQQIAEQIGTTSDGKGTNGSMVFVGNDLYLPENNDLGVIRNAVACTGQAPCTATPIALQNVFFAAALATDGTNVYVANSPGSAPGIVVRYNTATQAETVFATGGQLPVGGTPTTLVRCQYTSAAEDCARSEGSLQDALLFAPSTQEYPFRFILAMYVDPQGNLHFGDDPYAGSRAQRGHSWVIPSVATIP